MALPQYPASLPPPLLEGYALKRESNLLRTTMASGRARQRRRFVEVPTEMTAVWRMRSARAAVFEGFVTYDLDDGAGWYQGTVLIPAGLVTHTLRLITNPLEDCKPIGPQAWEYRARIEVKRRGIIERDIYDAIRDLADADLVLAALEDAVNNNQLTGE